jgi:SpoIID/LytB domain protein
MDGKVNVTVGGTPLGTGDVVMFMPEFLVEAVGPAEGFNFDAAGHEYRYGFVDVRVAAGDLEVVNQLAVNEYMKGLAEVPSSWPAEALKAQAIAGRTYAHRARGGQRWEDRACRCHVYDTVQSQVFAGYIKETGPGGANWVAAADGTVGQVVRHNGELASTNYFSSSGGRTQNNTDGFGGSTQFPYLVSVDDRWSLAPYNPFGAWEFTKTQSEVAAAFGLADVDRLDLTDRTDGSALRSVTAFSTSGQSAKITGTQFVSRLGLQSRWVGTPVVRVAGANRFATSVEIGKQAARNATTVVIVSGETANLVDGLVAGPLARAKSAPVLLTSRGALPPEVISDLSRRGATTAFVVGGQSAVSDSVVAELSARGVRVTRLSGADRYATAARVASELPANATAVIASGAAANLVDALAASAPAGAAGHPILLVDPSAIPQATRDALASRNVQSTLVAGGASAVSDAVVAELPSPTRLAGPDRYSTAAAVADHYVQNHGALAGRRAALASGAAANLVDALAAGSLGRALVLSDNGHIPDATLNWMRQYQGLGYNEAIQRLDVLGGRAAVGDDAFDQARGTVYP